MLLYQNHADYINNKRCLFIAELHRCSLVIEMLSCVLGSEPYTTSSSTFPPTLQCYWTRVSYTKDVEMSSCRNDCLAGA